MSSVLLDNVNDLAPSQACIKPFPIKRPELDTDDSTPTVRINTKRSAASSHFDQIRIDAKTKAATVSLQDCLACSGCVTSAETVLITNQSVDEFLSHHESPSQISVVTISPQALVALAHAFDCTELETAKKLTVFFKQTFNIDHVLDGNCSLNLSLMEAREEFISRYKKHSNTMDHFPLISSECPGWICYSEKVIGSDIIPHLSQVKSPQQIMGSYVKTYYASKILNISSDNVYHTCIMPCFDKKLEGAREEFYDKDSNVRDVDLVLTSSELYGLINDKCINFKSIDTKDIKLDHNQFNMNENNELVRPIDVGGSGGYLENVFRYAAKELFQVDIDEESSLEYKIGRNKDLMEAKLLVQGEEKLSFVAAYGFRNIQNIVRKIKTKKNKYHYIEIMACPSGCLNGGGQIKASEKSNIRAQKALIETLDELISLPSFSSYTVIQGET